MRRDHSNRSSSSQWPHGEVSKRYRGSNQSIKTKREWLILLIACFLLRISIILYSRQSELSTGRIISFRVLLRLSTTSSPRSNCLATCRTHLKRRRKLFTLWVKSSLPEMRTIFRILILLQMIRLPSKTILSSKIRPRNRKFKSSMKKSLTLVSLPISKKVSQVR